MTTNTVDRTLTAQDRCDRCNAAARIAVTFLTGELLFCGHHAKKTRESLQLKSVEIFDPEGILNVC